MSGPAQADAVLCVNGGQRAAVEGTWSASLEWLVGRLAPRFPGLRFAELRYRIKSWEHLDSCIDDARAALRELDAGRTLLVGFSMGGAVSSVVADEPSVQGVVGIAPWLPHQLPLDALAGKRLRVAPRLARPRAAGDPGRQLRELARRLRARAPRGCARGVHADPRRRARPRAACALGAARAAAAGTAWARLVADEVSRFEEN